MSVSLFFPYPSGPHPSAMVYLSKGVHALTIPSPTHAYTKCGIHGVLHSCVTWLFLAKLEWSKYFFTSASHSFHCPLHSPGATFRGLNPVLSLFPGPPTRWCHLGNSTELLYILFLLGQSLCQDSVASNSGIEGDFYFIQRQKQIFTEHLLYTGHGSWCFVCVYLI